MQALRQIDVQNQSPTGIMRSAVPLPCFFDVESQRVSVQRPGQRTEFYRMRRNFVCLHVHLSIHSSIPHLSMGSEGQLEGSEGWLVRSEGQTEGSEGLSEGPEGLPEGPEGFPGGIDG